ncbi:hypothetical protein TRVA0_001S01596 [Trichomonascus vanleenenianus]|uniref:uncharacterized protein n=1 Tax=Trichomonascus vanleenenianus TaxID=2268995 RepID=UPI003ECAB850
MAYSGVSPDSDSSSPAGGLGRSDSGSLYSIEAPKQDLSPMFPLILALLPAVLSLVLGEGAVALLADSLLLFADGWILWNISNGTWKFYAQAALASHQYATDSQPIGDDEDGGGGGDEAKADAKRGASQALIVSTYIAALVLHLSAPFGGGIVLYYSRKFLSSGSKVITNFNIFLYIAMELARGINRLTEASEWHNYAPSPASPTEKAPQMLERTTARVDLLEEDMNLLSSQMSALESRMDRSEENFYTELHTAWKTMEKMDKTLRLYRLQMKRNSHQKPSQLDPTLEFSTEEPGKQVPSGEHYLESIQAPNPYQQHRTLLWPAAIVWNSTVFVLLILPFRLVYTVVRRLQPATTES